MLVYIAYKTEFTPEVSMFIELIKSPVEDVYNNVRL